MATNSNFVDWLDDNLTSAWVDQVWDSQFTDNQQINFDEDEEDAILELLTHFRRLVERQRQRNGE